MLNSFFPFLSSPRPTPTIPHRFNEIKTIKGLSFISYRQRRKEGTFCASDHLFDNRNEIEEIKGVACSFAASCMNCSNKCSLIWFYDHVGSCISIFSAASNLFAARLSKKRVWHLHSVCSFWGAAYQFGSSHH
jgi:hypothetical protein